jgi:hypothetical protein
MHNDIEALVNRINQRRSWPLIMLIQAWKFRRGVAVVNA